MGVEPNGDALRTQLGPISLKNPIIVAAGTFGYGVEFSEFFDLSQLGALITKTLTLQPREGNPAPRVVETPSGMLNAVGLQNVGVDAFMRDTWPALKGLGVPVIISVAGFKTEEFVEAAKRVGDSSAIGIELNLSCPNVVHGPGARCFAQNADEIRSVVSGVRAVTSLPILAKLSPEVMDLPAMARAALEAGANILSLINTLPGMVIDVDRERPVLANGTGGMSGPALRPLAVRCIWEVYRACKAPILGLGGVVSGRDAMELILAGAAAVGVGTASFWNPRAGKMILDELRHLVGKKGRPMKQLIGSAVAA